MAAHLFSESGQMQEVDIPDIFDVLEGGEDENAVKYLLGFGGEDGQSGGTTTVVAGGGVDGGEPLVSPSSSTTSSSLQDAATAGPSGTVSVTVAGSSIPISIANAPHGIRIVKNPDGTERIVRRRDTSGAKAIYACQCCTKAFTTKFNLKRHINMHCLKSKEAGMPVQGPPSANSPTKKPLTHRVPKTERLIQQQMARAAAGNSIVVQAPSVPPPTASVSPSSASTIVVAAPHPSTSTPSSSSVIVTAPPAVSSSPHPSSSSANFVAISHNSTVASALTYQVAGAGPAAPAAVKVEPILVSPPPPKPLTTATTSSNILIKSVDPPALTVRPLQVVTTHPPLIRTAAANVQRPVTVITTAAEAPRVVGSINVPLLQTVNTTSTSAPTTTTTSTVMFPLASANGSGTSSVLANVAPIIVDSLPPNTGSSASSSAAELPGDLFDNSEPFSDGSGNAGQTNKGPTTFLGSVGGDAPLSGSLSITVKAGKPLSRLPEGWTRKPIFDRERGGVCVCYYDATGRRFSSQAEVDTFLARVLGRAAAREVFDFSVHEDDRKAVGSTPPPTFYQPSLSLERTKKRLGTVK